MASEPTWICPKCNVVVPRDSEEFQQGPLFGACRHTTCDGPLTPTNRGLAGGIVCGALFALATLLLGTLAVVPMGIWAVVFFSRSKKLREKGAPAAALAPWCLGLALGPVSVLALAMLAVLPFILRELPSALKQR